ncbi:MAG: cytochrome P450, partial [Betaproteobacteria bacterium]|nr:cytochrome P450 [Betaproteobacteria bacterium]
MSYDPAAPEVRRNPFPAYSQLQDDDPVHWSESLRSWVLTRYDDVRQVAVSDLMSPDRLRPFYAQLKGERRETLAEVMRYLSLWMVFRDPPEHTRLRRLVGTAFTPRSIEALAEPVGRVVDQLLDALPRDQPVDWAQQVAMPLPAYVILDLLGIPHQSYADLKAWSDELRAFIGSSRADPDRYHRARHGAQPDHGGKITRLPSTNSLESKTYRRCGEVAKTAEPHDQGIRPNGARRDRRRA